MTATTLLLTLLCAFPADLTHALDNLPAQQQNPDGQNLPGAITNNVSGRVTYTLTTDHKSVPPSQSGESISLPAGGGFIDSGYFKTQEKIVHQNSPPSRPHHNTESMPKQVRRVGDVTIERNLAPGDTVINMITIGMSLMLAALLVGFAYCYHHYWRDCPDVVNDLLSLAFIGIAVMAMSGIVCLPDFYGKGVPGVNARGWSACCFLLAALIGGIYMFTAPAGKFSPSGETKRA